MEIVAKTDGESLFVFLRGEMDEHSAQSARRIADDLADKHARCERAVFDFENVTFMDSTGIGFLIGRYKKFRRIGVPMYIRNPNPIADKILAVSGVYSLIPRI
ncbi:MAG: anti-sigma factor antagonist [Clostridia bacterium]|nr:anti-sigma factor antagonist [Clostridia bacterium]